MKFYISDLHFNHRNIIRYTERPFDDTIEMDHHLIMRWNAKVKKKDEVYIIGDFALAGGSYVNLLLGALNGRKFLVRGNHDSFLKDKQFNQEGFEWIKDYAKISDNGRKVILFHFPIASWDSQHYGSYHLYGHVHNHPMGALGENAFNVGVDVNDYEPMTLDELIEKRRRE